MEILYRGKRLDRYHHGNEWVYGVPIWYGQRCWIINDPHFKYYNEMCMNPWDNDDDNDAPCSPPPCGTYFKVDTIQVDPATVGQLREKGKQLIKDLQDAIRQYGEVSQEALELRKKYQEDCEDQLLKG